MSKQGDLQKIAYMPRKAFGVQPFNVRYETAYATLEGLRSAKRILRWSLLIRLVGVNLLWLVISIGLGILTVLGFSWGGINVESLFALMCTVIFAFASVVSVIRTSNAIAMLYISLARSNSNE